ncbi:MAG: calcium-binding protein [bacterium]
MAGSWNGLQYFGDDSAENVAGSDAGESFSMSLGHDVVNANGGDDVVDGGLGSDKLFGGAGNDVLYDLNSYTSGFSGLVGKDTLFGGAGDDTLWFNSVDSSDIGDGGGGTDTLVIRFNFLGASTDLPVSFALGPTTACYVDGILGLTALNFERVDIWASNGNDILTGGKLDDTLRGGGGDDTLSGLGGDDLVDVGTGNFAAFGGGGTDTLVIDLSNEFDPVRLSLDGHFKLSTNLTVGSADGFEVFSVTTGAGDDHLTGDALNDSLNGATGADVLYGAGGDDLLTLGLGAGRAYGGDGNDHITYSNSFFDPTPDPGDLANGGAGDDWIEFALGGNNKADGGIGNDRISVRYDSSTYGTVNQFTGGDGDDSVLGGNGADHLFGGAGNDVLSDFTRTQEMLGGNGDDILTVNGSTADPVAAGQVLDGGRGFDRLNWTGVLSGTVDLTTGDFTTAQGSHWIGFEAFGLFTGYASNTRITFGSGDDKLDGGGNAFKLTVDAGGGNDTITARVETAILYGGNGNDRLTSYYGTGSELYGGKGTDILTILNIGETTLDGGQGTDIARFSSSVVADLTLGTAVRGANTDQLIGIEGLTGSFYDDTLIGDAGDNQLYGGSGGSDVMTTGGGSDTVIVYSFQVGTTHVTDFSHASDSIGLSGFNFGTGALANGPINAANFLQGSFATAPTATLAEAQFFYDRSLGYLWLDRDGTGAAAPVLALILDNHPQLNASDMIVGDYFFQ